MVGRYGLIWLVVNLVSDLTVQEGQQLAVAIIE